MYKYSQKSKQRLNGCHLDLQVIFNEVLKTVDHSILCGTRSEKEQEQACRKGNSKLHYPLSKHNQTPSIAIDVAPYPIDWKDLKRFYFFGGFVLGIAEQLRAKRIISHSLRWGGDWDCDMDFKDQTFNDLVHFELI